MAITAVNPWRQRGEVRAHRPEDSSAMIGVHRNWYSSPVNAMTVKPLAHNANDGLAAVGCFDADLEGSNDGTCTVCGNAHDAEIEHEILQKACHGHFSALEFV